jgi:hypothetical protein
MSQQSSFFNGFLSGFQSALVERIKAKPLSHGKSDVTDIRNAVFAQMVMVEKHVVGKKTLTLYFYKDAYFVKLTNGHAKGKTQSVRRIKFDNLADAHDEFDSLKRVAF